MPQPTGSMEITTPVRLVLKHKGDHVWHIAPGATVFEAISMMAEKNIGALPVLDGGRLLGMISERDYSRKVILLGRASRETTVANIMTRDPATVGPDASVETCMQLMTDKHVRHLPILEETRLLGILSIGDLVHWIIGTQKSAIRDLENFVTGAYPG